MPLVFIKELYEEDFLSEDFEGTWCGAILPQTNEADDQQTTDKRNQSVV